MQTLDAGVRFPEIRGEAVEGGTVTLPGDLEGAPSLVVFYRGHW